MGRTQRETAPKREFDDSGCVQDGSTPMKKSSENKYVGSAQLLDLSDDVLLDILKYCSPMDLKALGYSCARFGSLIRDRSLWQRVNALGVPTGRRRLHWMLANTLHAGTQRLEIEGYAYQFPGCMGHASKTEKKAESSEQSGSSDRGSCSFSCEVMPLAGPSNEEVERDPEPPYALHRQRARIHITARHLPRFSASPSWCEEYQEEEEDSTSRPCPKQFPLQCPGPVFTLTPALLTRLRARCPNLTQLTLKGCNINCNAITLSQLPCTLKKLSLQGVKCFNMPMDKSFLFKIQDYLPDLQELDVSECDWMEPATLLPLSKMTKLQVLLMRNCSKMSEFVAYASLATRYGFKELRKLDLRGSPVGDSEVSALGWVVQLEELLLAVPSEPDIKPHSHPKRAARYYTELLDWELQEPNYFMGRSPSVNSDRARRGSSSSEETTRQVMYMKGWLRGRHGNLGHMRPNNADNPITVKPEIIDVSDDDDDEEQKNKEKEKNEENENKEKEDNSRRYRLRSSRNNAENGSGEAADDLPIAGPSKRKKVDDTVDRNVKKTEANTSKTTVSKQDNSKTSKNSENTECVSNANKSKTTASNAKSPADKKKADKKNDAAKNTDYSMKTEAASPSPQNCRVTRSNPKGTPSTSSRKKEEEGSSRKKEDEGNSRKKEDEGNSRKKEDEGNSRKKEDEENSRKKEDDRNSRKKEDEGSSRKKEEEGKSRKKVEEESSRKKEETPSCSKPSTSSSKPETPPLRKSLRSQTKSKEESDANSNKKSDNSKTSEKGNTDTKKPTKQGKRKVEDDDADEDETLPKRAAYITRSAAAAVNYGASTSKDTSVKTNSVKTAKPTPKGKGKGKLTRKRRASSRLSSTKNDDSSSDESSCIIAPENPDAPPRDQSYQIRCRPNCPPELVRLPFVPVEGDEDEPLPPLEPQNCQREPSHHLLYVNVGERFHAVYRLAPNRPAFGGMRSRARVSNLRNVFTSNPPYIDPADMVTDSAIRGFGRSEVEDMNYVLIGPNGQRQPRDNGIYNRLVGPGGQQMPATQRPDRVALRTLTVTGYRHVTDRSLIHLSEAAPQLAYLDVRGTSVTVRGVENFKALRPDCEVEYGPLKKEEPE